ncbi:MAG: site-specific integrase [Planctomycetaceae bacterium]
MADDDASGNGVDGRGVCGPGPRLLDRVRRAIRLRHLSPSTEKAYVHWAKRFILFHHRRPPRGDG